MKVRQAAGFAAVVALVALFTAAEPPAYARSTVGLPSGLLVLRTTSPAGQLTLAAASGNEKPARVDLDVPKGYRIDTGGRPAESPIGGAVLILGDPEATDPIVGLLAVSDASRFASDPAAQACDPGPHLAVWEIDSLTDEKASPLPVFLDAPGASDPVEAGYRIELCPPPAPASGFVVALAISVGILVEPTDPGTYLWHAFIAPATAGGTTPDPTTTYEVRAHLVIPQTFTIRARYDARAHQAVFTGDLLDQGKPRVGVEIDFSPTDDPERARSVETDAAGHFQIAWPITETTEFNVSAFPEEPGPCTSASTAPGGCRNESAATPPDRRITVNVARAPNGRQALNRADSAAAVRVNLHPADFPAGWTSRPLDPSHLSLCPGFQPNETALTVTGMSYSRNFGTPSQDAAALTRVFRTHAQAFSAFRIEAVSDQIQCFVDSTSGTGDVTVLS
ncbi:MAG: hypothetical protein ACJ77B_06040, partial [Chloroflexota bacterium]